MKQYVVGIMAASVIQGIFDMIIPGEHLKKHIHFLFSCVILFLMIAPLLSLFPAMQELSDEVHSLIADLEKAEITGAQRSEELIGYYQENAISELVKDKLEAEFQIDASEVTVLVEDENGESLIHIVLRGKASWSDGNRLVKYFSELLGCRVKVTRK